ncbi:hypothetical protein VTK73DRAFT_6024 [Phialemonium thermophilum]|uniref:AraC family transcriptional regulator n=1 Tax=Phialemonium thermophilum TaxID=223376 RepID=A0ABR3V0A7_9PEZI
MSTSQQTLSSTQPHWARDNLPSRISFHRFLGPPEQVLQGCPPDYLREPASPCNPLRPILFRVAGAVRMTAVRNGGSIGPCIREQPGYLVLSEPWSQTLDPLAGADLIATPS